MDVNINGVSLPAGRSWPSHHDDKLYKEEQLLLIWLWPPLSGCISSQASEELQQCCNLGSLLRRAEPFDTAVLIKITLWVIKQKSRRRSSVCRRKAWNSCNGPNPQWPTEDVQTGLTFSAEIQGKCTSFSAAHIVIKTLNPTETSEDHRDEENMILCDHFY